MKKAAITLVLINLFLTSGLSAASSEDHIHEVDRLEKEGLYKSAWTYLHRNAEEIDYVEMIIMKSELCIRYYATSNLHQMFAFVDLKEGETLEEVRRRRNSMEDLKLYDPEGGLLSALEKDPDNGEIHYWLGEYYFDLLRFFAAESGLSEEDLRYKIISHYRSAADRGRGDERLYANLGYTELNARDFSSSALHFQNALDINPENPAYHYNRAVALMNDNQLEQADIAVRNALLLDNNKSSRGDTLFLGSTIALMREDALKTVDYLSMGKEELPGDYRFPERLIQVYLVRQESEKALENSRIFFDLYPESPESCQTIMNHFNTFNLLELLGPFFEAQMPRYRENPEALGNLQYHQAVVSLLTGKEKEAAIQLDQAAATFGRIFPEDHQIFPIIEKLKDQSESR